VLFRSKIFELPAKPRSATAVVTVDYRYNLFVNVFMKAALGDAWPAVEAAYRGPLLEPNDRQGCALFPRMLCVPWLEEIWQRSGGRVTSGLGLFGIDSATALIAIRRDAGEKAEAGEQLAAIKDNVRRYREAGIIRANPYFYSADYEDGIAYYLSGESERGLALIAKGSEDGYFIRPKEAYLQALYDDPGFAHIRASREARQVRQREKFLAVVCTDNPYASFWQPAEETCVRYAAAGGN
jgi:hypothetical protein